VPVLSINAPLTPEFPAFALRIRTAPLLDFEPYPDMTETRPPLKDDDNPDEKMRDPPTPLSPDPTTSVSAPP